MTVAIMAWMVAIPLLGLTTGLRAMTAIAVLCWFAYLGYLPVQGTWAFWTASIASVIVFTLCALGEYVIDKLPRTPDRVSAGPLAARLFFGALVGSIAATAMGGPGIEGVLLGIIGATLGAFAGFMIRRAIVERMSCAEWNIAIIEDFFAVICAIFAMHVVTG